MKNFLKGVMLVVVIITFFAFVLLAFEGVMILFTL